MTLISDVESSKNYRVVFSHVNFLSRHYNVMIYWKFDKVLTKIIYQRHGRVLQLLGAVPFRPISMIIVLNLPMLYKKLLNCLKSKHTIRIICVPRSAVFQLVRIPSRARRRCMLATRSRKLSIAYRTRRWRQLLAAYFRRLPVPIHCAGKHMYTVSSDLLIYYFCIITSVREHCDHAGLLLC